jgi:signal transduction histidine kinase/DNA-binding response OmpR family regulator
LQIAEDLMATDSLGNLDGSANASHAERLIDEYARADIAELREQLSGLIGFALLLIGGAVFWASLPGRAYRPEITIPAFWVAISGTLVFALRKRVPALSHLVLLFGPATALGLYLSQISEPVALSVGVIMVIACSAIHPAMGVGSALLNTIPLLTAGLSTDVTYPAIGLLWLVAVFSFIFSRGLYTALAWAWQSEEHAERLVRQLRDRQQQINRNNSLLMEATRRLERTRNELAAARAHTDEARTLKERFAANISHELRTPLNLILGYTELMHLTPDLYGDMAWPVELRRDVAQVYRSAQHLVDLIGDVLELSKLDSMQMPIHREESSIAGIIYEACATMQQLAERQGITLCMAVPDDLPPLSVDAVRIRQVILNLISNALRHTARGRITVSAAETDEAVLVSVADTGSGIPNNELVRIFDEYHRVDTSVAQRHDGAGLGLAISKRFVEVHGGQIWAESIEGQGSVFQFTLPLAASDDSTLRHVAARPPDSTSAHPVMLLIDSDPAVQGLLQRHLQNVEVVRADDLAQALELVPVTSPRLVIVNIPPTRGDAPMPTQHVAQAFGTLPVIVASLPSNSWMSSVLPIHGALSKPISRQALSEVVSDLGGGDVLVVDDDRGFARLVKRYLEQVPEVSRIRTAHDGAEALRLCQEAAPDLLLLDLIMPDVDGFTVLEVLQTLPDYARTNVVIITATDYASQMLASRHGSLWMGGATSLSTQQTLRYLQALIEATPPSDALPSPAHVATPFA